MSSPIRYIDGAAWVRTWQRAGPLLEALREKELQHVDVAQFIQSTAELFDAVRARNEPRPTSGLVEQQRILHGRQR